MIDTFENRAALQTPASLAEAMRDQTILEAKAIMCDSKHNLIVDLKFMRGLIPREEGAIGIKDGSVRDIAILSRVNRPVCFLVQDFIRDEYGRITALLSRRAAQEKCREEFVRKLSPGDVIDARVTHIEPFGVFADIGCGIVSLLPIDSISVSRIEHPRERFLVGMDIRAVVKCRENARVTLSHKELLGTWAENAARFNGGKKQVGGIIRSIESYGVFVELAPNLAGLAEVKENIYPGQQASVFIKSILPTRMKVKLILIETFDPDPKKPSPPEVGHVVIDGHGEGIGLLEHHADLLAQPRHVHAGVVDLDAPVLDGAGDLDAGHQVVHPIQGLEEGGLAAAGGADEGRHLLLGDVHAHVLEGLRRAVPEVQPLG